MPAYTLETLDQCDIDRVIPFYHANTIRDEDNEDVTAQAPAEGNIVYRDGKPYRKVRPQYSVGLSKL